MARSQKKVPITGITTAESEKDDKVAAHRRERRCVRARLRVDPEPELLPQRRDVSNVWAYAKDGKVYAKAWLRPQDLRK